MIVNVTMANFGFLLLYSMNISHELMYMYDAFLYLELHVSVTTVLGRETRPCE